jgi:hypothetical protein
MKVLLANHLKKKVQSKNSRIKNANIFRRKKHTKFVYTDEDRFTEGDCGFWRFRHVKITVLEIGEYRRRYLHLNYDKKTHIRYYNNITSKNDISECAGSYIRYFKKCTIKFILLSELC